MTPLAEFLSELTEALTRVAPTMVGARNLASNVPWPRYVVVVKGASSEAPLEVGGNPRALLDDLFNVDISCWGKDLDHALRLRQVAITVLARMQNNNTDVQGTAIVSDVEEMDDGSLVVLSITIRVPLCEAALPSMEDDVHLTVRPERVAIDDDNPVLGDGQLDAPGEPS